MTFPRRLPGSLCMQSDAYEELYVAEQTHWWYVGKRERVLRLLERFSAANGGPRRILDVGCGTGGFLEAAARCDVAVGMDHEPLALALCRRRGARELIQHDVASSPWPIGDRAFDVVTALDVIEHVDDDAGCLAEIARVLKPGGVAIVNVPSFQWLWSYWDEQVGHRRRYTRPQLAALMRRAGLQVVWASYAGCATLPLIVAVRWWKQRQVARGRPVASDNAPPPVIVNRGLLWYERMENHLLRWGRLPWGTSVAAVGVKG